MQSTGQFEQRGLCCTCNNGLVCAYRKKRGFDAIYCEMYDCYSPAGEDSAGLAAAQERAIATADSVRVEFTGLCANCDHRHSCTISKPDGGVWHCEEYC